MKKEELALKSGEVIEYSAEISKGALLVTWLAIPTFIFVPSAIAYIPKFFKSLLTNGIKNLVFGDAQLPSFPTIWNILPDGVGTFLKVLITIPVILAILVWLGVCLVLTQRHFQNSLFVTNYRVIGESVDGDIYEDLSNIKNVYVEQPLFGKIFNYGAIVISGKKQSLTIKNIHDPQKVYKMLLTYAESYCAS